MPGWCVLPGSRSGRSCWCRSTRPTKSGPRLLKRCSASPASSRRRASGRTPTSATDSSPGPSISSGRCAALRSGSSWVLATWPTTAPCSRGEPAARRSRCRWPAWPNDSPSSWTPCSVHCSKRRWRGERPTRFGAPARRISSEDGRGWRRRVRLRRLLRKPEVRGRDQATNQGHGAGASRRGIPFAERAREVSLV